MKDKVYGEYNHNIVLNRNAKTRLNYPTGGWCGLGFRCLNRGKLCHKCIMVRGEMTEFEEVSNES